MLQKQIFLISFLLFLSSEGESSRCTYFAERFFPYSALEKESPLQVICYNVSSDLVLDFDKNSSQVRTLVIGENSTVESLPPNSTISALTELSTLILKFLGIQKISPEAFDNLTKLEQLNLGKNKLNELPVGLFKNLEQLKSLMLSENQIGNISNGVFGNLKLLQVLDLSFNLISYVEDGTFSELISLKKLVLDGNNLKVLQEGLFQNLTSLIYLQFSFNPIETIEDVGLSSDMVYIMGRNTSLNKLEANSYLFSIVRFDISGGKLEEFDFGNLGPVPRTIDLSKNNISVLKHLESAQTENLNLNNNAITKVGKIPKNLTVLSLQHNKIKNLDNIEDSRDYRLLVLDLSFNQIKSGSCLGLTSLLYLFLQNNQITVVRKSDFGVCSSVITLDLSFNDIEEIEESAFEGAKSLKILRLSNNRLKTLNPDSFLNVQVLTDLYFDNNALESIDVEELAKRMSKLKQVKFNNNLLLCDDLGVAFQHFRLYHIHPIDGNSINSVRCIKNGEKQN